MQGRMRSGTSLDCRIGTSMEFSVPDSHQRRLTQKSAKRLSCSHHTECRHPGGLGPATMPVDLGEHLLSHGLQYVGDARGMAIDLLQLRKDVPNPPCLTVTNGRCGSVLEDFLRVYAAGSDDPESYVHMLGEILRSLKPGGPSGWQHFLGYLDDSPVACSALFLGNQLAGLFRVAVIPEVRGRGIGSAISMAALLLNVSTFGWSSHSVIDSLSMQR